MKRVAILTALAVSLAASPAFAGGKGGLNLNANVSTGKNGVIGTLLGGKNTIKADANVGKLVKVDANVKTGKNGLVGGILGGLGGHGCGCH